MTSIDYQKGKIYRIDGDNELLYVGSTAQHLLCSRRAMHVSHSKVKNNSPFYRFIQEREDGWNGITLTLVEDYPCERKEQLLMREREVVRDMKPKFNINSPIQTKEELKEYQAAYHKEAWKNATEEVKEKIRAKQRKRSKLPEVKEWHKNYMDVYNKKYYEENADKLKAYQKEYNEANKEKVQARQKLRNGVKEACIHCGQERSKKHMKEHIRRCHSEKS